MCIHSSIRNSSNSCPSLEHTGDRLVSGSILAGVVYLPRLSRCYFAIANPLEIRLLARQLLQGSIQRLRLSSIGQLSEDPSYRISDNPAGKLDYGVVDLSRRVNGFEFGTVPYTTTLLQGHVYVFRR